MDVRYTRNFPAISPQEQQTLAQKRVLVAGCGGLGGYAVEYLSRLGVGTLTVADADTFSPTDLNRQLLCTASTLNTSKVHAAAQRVAEVNPKVTVRAVEEFLCADNLPTLLEGQDLVVDALDNVPSRLLLEQACARQGVCLIHGAICGWSAQVALVPPGSGLLTRLYAAPAAEEKTVLPFTPALCAAMQCALAAGLLCGREDPTDGRLLLLDLEHMDWQSVPLQP